MKDFREAFPTPDHLDDTGCERLMAAIIIQAASDYYDCLRHYPKGLEELREFLGSRWYNFLTSIDPKDFEREIQFRWRSGINLAAWIGKWRARLEVAYRCEEYKTYYNPQYLTNLLHDYRYTANWKYDKQDHMMKPIE